MLRALQILLWVCCCNVMVMAQHLDYARHVLNDLCAEQMAGRGYVKDGAEKAATYISNEYRQAGLQAFGADYFQPIGYPVIAFPYDVTVKLDDTELIPGEDYIVGAGCPAIKGIFDVFYIDSAVIDDNVAWSKFEKISFSKTVIYLNMAAGTKLNRPDRLNAIKNYTYKVRAIVFANQTKLTWSVATTWDTYPAIYMLQGAHKDIPQKISLSIEPELRSYNGKNVIGYIKGNKYPDSFVVFSAHYDHLGMMGRWALFPGANDNASGVAMMLDLMQNYADTPPPYSICFIAFTGEEAGLFGSYYYTQNPLFPLSQISLLINLDLMATGDKGMTVVNGSVYPGDFQDLQLINFTNNYLPVVNARGKAQNSDHYFFSENGVKSFFFYLMGEYKAYHDVFDTPEAVTFSKYNEAFMLIRDFADEYQRK